MDDEPKSAAELKEIRLKRKRDQEVEGIKAMAEIAAADVAIRKRTEKLRALAWQRKRPTAKTRRNRRSKPRPEPRQRKEADLT
jgi:hypothetical protein